MFRAVYVGAIIGCIGMHFGCSQSSNPSQSVKSTAEATDPVARLLEQYQQLPDQKRNGLSGDQIIMQIETLLKSNASQASSQATAVVAEHNKKMLRRALEVPDLMEVIGTEVAPTPRER